MHRLSLLHADRPLRSYEQAATDFIATCFAPGVRITDERMRLLHMIEREMKFRELRYLANDAKSRNAQNVC